MSIDVGSKAPDFTLISDDRQPVTLSALRGRPVVLAFFPPAFSSVCTKQLCTFRHSFAPTSAQRRALQARARARPGAEPERGRTVTTSCTTCGLHAESAFSVEGMDCREEFTLLERRFKNLRGLEAFSADLMGRRLHV